MELNDAAKKLQEACNTAFDANQSSCSNAVWDVIKALVNPNEQYREANDMINNLSANWKTVTVDDGYDLANKGIVVVGGTKKVGGHGHVIVIYPGDKISNGGYLYFWKKGKKYITLATTGKYPRAMSTSSGSWPGAKSRGDKTVWDPWGSDDAFDEVQFWTPKGA